VQQLGRDEVVREAVVERDRDPRPERAFGERVVEVRERNHVAVPEQREVLAELGDQVERLLDDRVGTPLDHAVIDEHANAAVARASVLHATEQQAADARDQHVVTSARSPMAAMG
jgi:hypothetical protein